MKKIGLLAGVGRLPVEFARAASGMGITVIAVGVVPGVEAELAETAAKMYSIGAGELDKIIATLVEEGVAEVAMIGKVTKELMFGGAVVLDNRMQRLLAGLPDRSDDTIMLGVVKELAAAGIGVLDQTALIRQLMPGPGVLSRRQPTEAELADMEFGVAMAKQIGALDIGQTVVVKNRAVMAVEAIEGTDACIRRGAALGRGGVTVAKVAKPNQDLRFDVPSVGPDTIRAMVEGGAAALVIEAGKTLMVDRRNSLALADEHNITIIVR
ncbi:MAG: UDP-2,3-diacylglucosamine diphosphatase LpxI [Negativicutes bacterium]|nr:UDP-2,3-diacylglucosamine diphosphatase LpxI [Negativicutes bacterium]